MKRTLAGLVAACAVVWIMAGCGTGGPKTSSKSRKQGGFTDQSSGSEWTAWNIPMDQLMRGIDQHIELERAAVKDKDGSPGYMGFTKDRQEEGNKFASLIVYGTPEKVTHVYFASTIDFASYTDPEKYPDYMKRNASLQERLLTNIFSGKVPDAVQGALNGAKSSPNQESSLVCEGRALKINYSSADKKMCLDIK